MTPGIASTSNTSIDTNINTSSSGTRSTNYNDNTNDTISYSTTDTLRYKRCPNSLALPIKPPW